MCAIELEPGARLPAFKRGAAGAGRRPLVSLSGARPLHRRGRARVGAARGRWRGAAALLSEAKHQPRRSDPVLAHLRVDDREQAAPHTHRAPRAGDGSNSQGPPRGADAISKAGVRRLDTGRVVRHDLDRQGPPGRDRLRPNAAVRLRRTAPAARRSHSGRAIVSTRPEPAMPMATSRSPDRGKPSAVLQSGHGSSFT